MPAVSQTCSSLRTTRQPLPTLFHSATIYRTANVSSPLFEDKEKPLGNYQEILEATYIVWLSTHRYKTQSQKTSPQCGCRSSYWPSFQASTYQKLSANLQTASFSPKSPVSLYVPAKRLVLVAALQFLSFNARVATHGVSTMWT